MLSKIRQTVCKVIIEWCSGEAMIDDTRKRSFSLLLYMDKYKEWIFVVFSRIMKQLILSAQKRI